MTQSSSAITPGDIGYATPLPARPPARTFAAACILFGGLALVGLAGCFLIGVMLTIQHIGPGGVVQQMPLTPTEAVFVAVLSVLALLSLIGGAVLLYLGTRALLRVTLS